MNSTPESNQPAEHAEAEPDALQRVIDEGRLPGLPSEADEAEDAAEQASLKARKAPGHISDMGNDADELIGFNQRMD